MINSAVLLKTLILTSLWISFAAALSICKHYLAMTSGEMKVLFTAASCSATDIAFHVSENKVVKLIPT